MEMLNTIASSLLAVKKKSPLVHQITNYVTVNDCANVTLAIGGSPVMADDLAEAAEMAALAQALVLNIGTLNARTIAAMLAAGKTARNRGIPVILDPVGIGATKLRTDTVKTIIEEVRPTVIRGNMSEIKCLAGFDVEIKGVDSIADERQGALVARTLAKRLKCIIAITGKQDFVSDGTRTTLIDNGHELLSKVSGTGCMTSALVGAYCGAMQDWYVGTVAGILTMGLSGEIAEHSLVPGDGIGMFKVRLFDAIYNLSPENIRMQGRISCE
ncbi:MAG: hydroxyethylthiazole kinase [Lentisphaerota bacterium]